MRPNMQGKNGNNRSLKTDKNRRKQTKMKQTKQKWMSFEKW